MCFTETLENLDGNAAEEMAATVMIDAVDSSGGNAELPPVPVTSFRQPPVVVAVGECRYDYEREFAPKKRAETWLKEETRILIALRREMDSQFNVSKSNRHLWERISRRMRQKGFNRSASMCTEKWRNLMKDFKKSKQQQERENARAVKMSYYKDIEELLRDRAKNFYIQTSTTPNQNVESYMQFTDKGIDVSSTSFVSAEATGGQTFNSENHLDLDGYPLPIPTADTIAANGVPTWNWSETPLNSGEGQSYLGKAITVTWGGYARIIGIDGTSEAIRESIRAAFRLRTKRLFWLEDEHHIIRTLDRDMALGNYTLHLDEGIPIKLSVIDDESDHIPLLTEDKIFYNEDDHHNFLIRRGWTCLQELDGFRNVDNFDDLQPGAIYRGVR